jgi:hypothetical protein
MEKISSGTFIFKWVFPTFWFGFLVFFLVSAGWSGNQGFDAFIIMPFIMAVFGFFLFRKFIWDLADEVEDHGDYLRVRRGSVDERVPLSNVMNVSMNQLSNPPRLTLRLRKAGALGDEIAFIPRRGAFRLNPFARNEIAERLLLRVDRAHTDSKQPT